MAGFQFSETMSGHYTRDGQERPFSFQGTARASSLWRFLRDRKASFEGVVDAEGLAENARFEGTLTIDPLIGRIIRYEFEFPAADGRRYRFAGQKDVSPLRPVASMTTLPGEIRDASGELWAHALVHFDTRTLLPFMASFRPVL